MKYSILLNLDEELKLKLEHIAKKLHTNKSQAIRYLILNYDKD
ncbi:ribbon-helix-helix protein, CopG family [Clostridium tertium]